LYKSHAVGPVGAVATTRQFTKTYHHKYLLSNVVTAAENV